MTLLEPFAATRYDAARVDLASVVAPPYDVIDDAAQADLEARSPFNAVRLELSRDESGHDRYEAARANLAAWLDAGILVDDPDPAFYVYRMGFVDPEGRPRQTTGVLGALRLDRSGDGSVLPHERTLARPLGDRLRLLRACRANLSPIWCLSLAGGLTAACEPSAPPTARATDALGVHHRLWRIDTPAAVEAIAATADTAPVVIADGHHRYQTALAYREEQPEPEADRTLAYVVELAEEQLCVRAIHRLVGGLDSFDVLLGALSEYFEVSADDRPGPVCEPATGSDSLLLVSGKGRFRLRPVDAGDAQPDSTPVADSELVARALANLPGHTLVHHHDAGRLARRAEAEDGAAALLLRPVTVQHLTQVARAGVRLPEKSTYFHPKPLTGMVFRRLRAR